MKKIMTPLFLFLAISVLQNSEAMLEDAANKTSESVKKPRTRKKYIKADGQKVCLTEQNPESLATLFMNSYSSFTIKTPKKEGKRQLSNSRKIYDELTKKVGGKHKAKEALKGTADDFSDEEEFINWFWESGATEEIANPNIYLGICYGYSSEWKENAYEYMKEKNRIITAQEQQIQKKQEIMSELEKQKKELDKKIAQEYEIFKNLITVQEIHENKLQETEKYSLDLIAELSNTIEETIKLIAQNTKQLELYDHQLQNLRRDTIEAEVFNNQRNNIIRQQSILTDQNQLLNEKLKSLTQSYDHVSSFIPKAKEPGSLGRFFGAKKNNTLII